MKANPNFWRGAPAVDEVDFKIYKGQDALGQALKKGEIDFADSLESNVFKSLQNTPGITTVSAIYSGFNELAFNTGAALDDGTPIGDGNPLLKDKALRVALGWAIDRDALVSKVLGGGGSAGSTIIPPMYANLHADPTNPVTYDPEKAKQLLDAAGYKVGSDGIRADAKGNRLSFRLFGRSDSSGGSSPKSVDFIKGYLQAVGVEVKKKIIASDSLTEIIGQGNFDMFEWGWVVEPDPNYQLSTFTCANRSYKDSGTIYANLSDSFYCNPAYDKLFEQQSTETDVAKRTDIVKQMQQMLYDDAPYVLTYYYDNPEAYRSDRFTGFVPQPKGRGALLFQYGTWSYENIKPVVADAGTGSTDGGSDSGSTRNWILIMGVIAIVIVVWGLIVVNRRQNRGSGSYDDDRE
jgi:peptide/nickel transport system substrate-binding protein